MSAEICKISRQTTALGRLITAKAALTGKVMLSGPADTATLKAVIRQNEQLGAKLTIVDGALSRLSLSAPSVTDATILATGAALSANIPQLVHATKYVCDKIALPVLENPYYTLLNPIDNGIWTIDHEGNLADTGCQSALQVKDIQNISGIDDKSFTHRTAVCIIDIRFVAYFKACQIQGRIYHSVSWCRDNCICFCMNTSAKLITLSARNI